MSFSPGQRWLLRARLSLSDCRSRETDFPARTLRAPQRLGEIPVRETVEPTLEAIGRVGEQLLVESLWNSGASTVPRH